MKFKSGECDARAAGQGAMKAGKIALCALLLAAVTRPAFPIVAPAENAWLYGYWELATDEDGGQKGMDVNEFRPDGVYSILGPNCRAQLGRYHLYDGDIYITFDVAGKGPVAMIYRPNSSKTILTYTSPRTRNNATYQKLQRSPCDHG